MSEFYLRFLASFCLHLEKRPEYFRLHLSRISILTININTKILPVSSRDIKDLPKEQTISQIRLHRECITSSKAGITIVGSFFDVGIFRGSKMSETIVLYYTRYGIQLQYAH